MNRETSSDEEQDELSIVGLLRPLWSHRRFVLAASMTVTGLAVVLSVIHYLSQPVRWIATLEFSPTFSGAATNRYPNGLPFAPSDVTDPSVLDQVYDANKLQDLCTRDDFRSAFFIEQRSAELQMIDSEYQSKLSDTKLTAVERQRLMDEYQARRSSARVQYGVTFIRPAGCQKLTATVTRKVLDDVVLTWAKDAEFKRGVLKQRVHVLTPYVLDVGSGDSPSIFVHANLVWTNVDRVIRNIEEVELLPGAQLVRFGPQQVSLAEVKARMVDLERAQLEPLMTAVNAGRDREAVSWVEEALVTATTQLQLAQSRARANLDALREYSGIAPQPTVARGDTQRPLNPSDVQSLTPQIDRTFIDRIVEMSAPNISFRQDLTRAMVTASLEAVEAESVVDHYKQLLAALKNENAGSSTVDFAARLSAIVTDAKNLIRQFDGIYDEWSRVSFRAGPALYRTERPAAVEIARPTTLSSYATAIALTFFVVLILASLFALLHARLWPALVGRA